MIVFFQCQRYNLGRCTNLNFRLIRYGGEEMRIKMLGTGHATVTKCYNTCFTIDDGNEYFLVDAGGGNEVLRILEEMEIPIKNIHNIFVSHAHTDHLFGVIWIIRMIGQMMNQNKYQGALTIYCHKELSEVLCSISKMVLAKKVLSLIGDRIIFDTVEPGECVTVLNRKVEIFDVNSSKMKQYGFIMKYEAEKELVYSGDEPLSETMISRAQGCEWLLHEAFCKYEDKDVFHPYEKSHSTVKDACELAERLKCKNLILYHTEDSDLRNRKSNYTREGSRYYKGNLFVPNDREILEL